MAKYVMEYGKKYYIQIAVSYQPKPDTQVNADLLLTTYAGDLMNETLTKFQQKLAQEQLTQPELIGWNVYNIEIQSKSVSFSNDIFNPNPILHLTYNIYFDGTKAFYNLTFEDDEGTNWFDNMIIYLKTFFMDFITNNPLIILYNDIKVIGLYIIEGIKDTFDWIREWWWVLLLGGVGIIILGIYLLHYINGGD